MKKIFLGAALMLAFAGTAIAQTDNKTQTSTTSTTVTTPAPAATTTAPATSAATTVPATTSAADMNATTTATAGTDQDKDFAKVQQSQIAPAVLKEAVAKYKDYALVEALAATDGSEYKLVLTKDGKDVAAYYKSNGEFIKEETV